LRNLWSFFTNRFTFIIRSIFYFDWVSRLFCSINIHISTFVCKCIEWSYIGACFVWVYLDGVCGRFRFYKLITGFISFVIGGFRMSSSLYSRLCVCTTYISIFEWSRLL